MLRAVIVLWIALAVAAPAAAQNSQRDHEATIAAATAYLDAYQAFDLERLETLYAEEATFDDPTSLHLAGVNGAPFVFRGRDAILNGIRYWMQNSVTSLHYDVEEVYESSGRVVFVGAATANGPSRWRFRIVTIVTIENGLVVEHRDYTDYWGATQVQPANP
ncbi:MAG: nuclear transport factor 2 family protein [Terricaulis sp.]